MAAKGPVLIVADQGLNSISNFAIVAIIARSTTVRQFGVFALSQACVLLLLACIQAGTADSFLREADASKRRALQEHGVRSILATSGLCAVLCVASALSRVTGVSNFSGCVLCLSLIAGIDFARNSLIADGRFGAAVLLDSLYAISQLGFFLVFVWHHSSDVREVWWVWTVSTIPALAIFWPARLYRSHIRFGTASFRFRYAIESFMASGSSQIAQFLVTPVLGIAFSARYRAGQLLMGPLTVYLSGGRTLVLTLYRTRTGLVRRRMMVQLCFASCAFTLLWGTCVLLLPRSGLRVALGANGVAGRSLVPALIAAYLAQAVFMCIYYYARSEEADRATTQGRAASAAALVVVVVYTQFARSANWYVVGTAGSIALACVVMVAVLRRRGSDEALGVTQQAIDPESVPSHPGGRHRRSH